MTRRMASALIAGLLATASTGLHAQAMNVMSMPLPDRAGP